ncbi:hypothetical protein GW17_00003370 [Ensete ventricosum]|nr:hypothetical protein GW17_00003370 [Ensete ventricosum]
MAVHIGLPGYRYMDCLLPGGTAKIDRRRSTEREKGKKKRKKREKRRRRSTSHRGHPHAVAARGKFFSHMRRRNVSPRGGGDVTEASPHLQHSTREGSVGSGSSRGGRAGSGREVLPLLLPLSLSLFFSLTAARLILPDKAVTVKIDRYRPVSGGNGAETTLINGIIR